MSSQALDGLSLAAPAYNEADGIASVISEWVTHLDAGGWHNYEIVVCNDGSRDDTGKILDGIAAANPHVRPVHHERNRGAAVALATAIGATTEGWVLLIDSDGQFPIENLDLLKAEQQRTGADVVVGLRHKQDNAFARAGSWASGIVANLAHRSKLRDFNSALKLVRGDLIRSLTLEAVGLNYSTEITSRLLERGATVAEVQALHRPRTSGKSSMKLFKDASHRLMFVGYVAFRQFLIRQGVIRP